MNAAGRVLATVVALLLVGWTAPAGTPLWGPPPALGDPAPADDQVRASALAGGWLARQVTGSGRVVGTDPVVDLADGAWAVLGLLASGVGRTAADRAAGHLLDVASERGVDELGVHELALLALMVSTGGGDPAAAGPAGLDLSAALEARTQDNGPDAGRVGMDTSVETPVRDHSLALLALTQAGREVTAAQRAWLAEQQCPNGGWPTYRDPAARSTGTCELLPAATAPTGLATLAAAALDVQLTADPTRFLREAQDDSGGFGPAPGLAPTPGDTALAILSITALTGAAPDPSWTGSAGGPVTVMRQEQLGCGWHGGDRGAVPAGALDTDDDPPPPPPADRPGAAAGPRLVALSAMALAGAVPPFAGERPAVGDPFPDCPVSHARWAGAGRIDTALAVSRGAFPDGAATAVVATSRGYADALAATALAGSLQAPILLSEPDMASEALLDELGRLEVEEVVLMGGATALSARVAEQVAGVEGVSSVRRVAGATRFETAAMATAEVGGERVFIVRGSGPERAAPWADALAVGAWAATRGIGVLLTEQDNLPEVTAEAARGHAEALIVGGEAAVSAAVQTQVAQLVDSTTRLAGPNRVATSSLVLRAAFADGVDARTVLLTTSRDYPDGLAAGPAAAASGGTMLLVDPDLGIGDPAVLEGLLAVDYLVDHLRVVGGTAQLADDVPMHAADLVRQGIDG